MKNSDWLKEQTTGQHRALSRFRQIACAEFGNRKSRGMIRFLPTGPVCLWNAVCDEANGILVKLQSGAEFCLYDKGAGRWPAALSVVADRYQ